MTYALHWRPGLSLKDHLSTPKKNKAVMTEETERDLPWNTVSPPRKYVKRNFICGLSPMKFYL